MITMNPLTEGLAAQGIQRNASLDSAMETAGAESFQNILQQAKNKVDAAQKSDSVTTSAQTKKEQELRDACKGFEAMFLNIMYKEMRNTVPENSLFGDSNADKILQDMRDTEMVNQMAKAGGVGLADVLYKQLTLEDKAKADWTQRVENMSPKDKVVRT